MLELFHNDMSTASQRVRFVLAEKKLDWTDRHMNLGAAEQHQPDYLKINPSGMVPALVDDGAPITEASVITEYLEDKFPERPLMPADPLLRARVRAWTMQVDENIQAFAGVVSIGIAMRHGLFAKSLADIDAGLNKMPDVVKRERQRDVTLRGLDSSFFPVAIRRYQRMLADMSQALEKSDWLVGDRLSLADIAIAPYVTRLDQLQLSFLWERLPSVISWYERMKAHPSYRDSHTKWFNEKGLELMKNKGLEARSKVQQVISA
jgi:glutathione S-transferase